MPSDVLELDLLFFLQLRDKKAEDEALLGLSWAQVLVPDGAEEILIGEEEEVLEVGLASFLLHGFQ